jgi:serpin B
MKIQSGLYGTMASLVLYAGSAVAENVPVPEFREAAELVAGNTAFAVDLYREIVSEQGTGNIFFSPYSISTALGMTYAGAEGQTEAEMAEVLHFSLPQETLHSAFSSLRGMLAAGDLSGAASGEPFTMFVANGLWVQEGFDLQDQYISLVTSCYDAAVTNLDLAGDSEGSRLTINQWVADMTRERITDLIPQGVINADTRVVLTNAVYFKASWFHSFNEMATSRGLFTLADRSSVEVPMMHQTEYFQTAETAGCRAIELPYVDGDTGMLILLPDDDIEAFEQEFDVETLETISASLASSRISLTMPAFEFTRSIQLGKILKSMGMVSAFSSGLADFSGFTGQPDLFISEVLHKAFVKVDESGTEAAAATAVVMGLTCVPAESTDFIIDRPFLFLIRNRSTGTVIFMGRVMDPSV